jgi:hypothetical protein
MLLKSLDLSQSKQNKDILINMNVEFIEQKLNEIFKELEKEVMSVLMDESLDKKQTNLHMKPLTSTKQILTNALESIRMVDRLGKEALDN